MKNLHLKADRVGSLRNQKCLELKGKLYRNISHKITKLKKT